MLHSEKREKRRDPILKAITYFISGCIAAAFIEPLSVFFNWWECIEIGKRGVLYFPIVDVRFHLMVILGWGLLTIVNLSFSKSLTKTFTDKIMSRMKYSRRKALALSNMLLGLFSGYFSWELTVNSAATIEGVPIFFLEKNIFYRIESLLVLIITVALLVYAYRKLTFYKLQ